MTTTADNAVLHDEWATNARDYSQVIEWIPAGDHVVGCAERVIFCASMYTGTELTGGSFPFRLSTRSGDPNVAFGNDIVYFLDATTLHAITIATNAPPPAWNPSTTFAGVASVQVLDDVLVIVYTDDQGDTLIAGLDPATGQAAWPAYTVTQSSPGLIGLGDDAAYFVAGNQLIAVNVGSGQVRFAVAGPSAATVLDQSHVPLVVGETVYCGGNGVFAFHYRTGANLWSALATSGSTWAVADTGDGALIATGGAGEICRIRTADGNVTPAVPPTVPAPGDPLVVGDMVYTLSASTNTLFSFDLFCTSQQTYTVGISPTLPPIVGNGCIFAATTDGLMHAMPFTTQPAAYFDGAQTYFTIPPTAANDFDFGLADFSLELWVRSSYGGELLCSYPTGAGHGFRLNLAVDGSLQFAIADAALANADLWATKPTSATDGSWHHVAVVRYRGTISLYLDGVAQKTANAFRRGGAKVNPYFVEQTAQCAPLPLEGGNVLVGGAYLGAATATPNHFFTGLLCELRVWQRALDATKITARMHQRLNFLTTDLIGNWHFDGIWNDGAAAQQQTFANDVQGRLLPGTCYAAWSCMTDLEIGGGDYPFPLEKAALPWPYQSTAHWAVCGEDPISVAPVIGASGTVCFGDGKLLYGVDKLTGARRWGVELGEGASAPVADGSRFLAVDWQFGMMAIDAVSGAWQSVPSFGQLIPQDPDRSAPLTAPATSASYIVAAGPNAATNPGFSVWVQPRTTSGTTTAFVLAVAPQNLQIAGDWIAAFAGGAITVANGSLSPVQVSLTVPADVPAYYIDAQRLICVQNGALACYLFGKTQTTLAYGSAALDGHVTGMTATSDGSLLVVTTDAGVAYGFAIGNLQLHWSNAHAEPIASAYFAPAVYAGYALVTSASGLVIALDLTTGESVARYQEPHQIVTPATIDQGTLYYGCAPQGNDGLRDGALHSVALGGSYALRLGLGPTGSPRGYASIASATPIRLFAADEMSLETWVNTQAGGEIITVLPVDAPQSFFANLALGAAGEIAFAFASRSAASAPWVAGAWTTPATLAIEGKWHHIAVCVNGIGDVRIYLDGVQQTLAAGTSPTVPAVTAQTAIVIGGGAVDATGKPTAFYNGMLGDLRLWDDYLTIAEISDRMHDKLVGDEPDLIAYWNFDAKMIHDSARNGFDGALVQEDVDADYWLTDLTFTPTTYPTVTSSAVMRSSDAQATVYEMTITTRKADQTPLAAKLNLWYIATDGSTIQVATATGNAQTLQAQAPGKDTDAAQSFAVATDQSGTVVLTVTTANPTAGPSLDLRADFMYPNERYHLNTLVNDQNFTRPPSSTLVFQTKMLEDYSYVHGDDVSTDSHRDTFQVIVKAVGPDGSPLINEAVTVWADETLTIEVAGVSYPINDVNGASLLTDASGEVPIIIAADDLHCPQLSVWAGFMQRDDRVKVAPDAEGQATLAGVQGQDLTATQNQQWTPTGKQQVSVLTGDYRDHAPQISETVRHLSAAGQSASSSSGHAALAARRALRAVRARAPFVDMSQPPPMATADVAAGMRTLMHIDRATPLTPEFMLASLAKAVAPGQPAPIGFYFSCQKKGDLSTFQFKHLTSVDEYEQIKASRPATPHTLEAHLLGSIWSDIEDAAEDVWNEAKSIAIKIGDTVEAAIETAAGFLTTVIDDVKTAFLAIAKFIEQLALEIVAFIKFLLSFFDWGTILATAKRLNQIFSDSMTALTTYVQGQDLGGKGAAFVEWLKGQVDTLAGASLSTDTVASAQAQYPNPSPSGMGSLQGKYTQKKLAQYGPQASVALTGNGGDPIAAGIAAIGEGVIDALTDFISALPNVASMSMSDLAHLLGKMLTDILDPVLDDLAALVQAFLDALVDLYAAALSGLDTPIDIPFLSALYKWITGDTLTFGSVASLALAVPMHIMCELLYQKPLTDLVPASWKPFANLSGTKLAALDAEDDGWLKSGYLVSGMLVAVGQAFCDVFAMARAVKQFPAGWFEDSVPSPPSTPEYLSIIALAMASAFNAGCHAGFHTPQQIVVGTGQISYQAARAAYSAYRLYSPGTGSVEWYDKLLPVVGFGVGVASIVLTFTLEKDSSDGEKAVLTLTSIPFLYRPVVAAPIENPYVVATIAFLDFSLISTAAIVEGTS